MRLAAKENERAKAAAEEEETAAGKRLQQQQQKQQQEAEEAKLNAKKKAHEEWTKRERAAQDEWLAEQERIAQLEAEEDEAEERLEQQEKKGYAVPHMTMNTKSRHHPSTPSVRGPTNMASLDSLLNGLPSTNSSGGSRASKKKKGADDDDDASVFTTITKASLYSTARSVTSHYSRVSTTSKKSISSHYSRAHEAASVADKVKEAYKAKLQQQKEELANTILKTAPQWESYYLQDQGRIYSAEYEKLWSASSYKHNVNGIVKRGIPLRGKERLKVTKMYLNNAYRAKLDDLDEDDEVSIESSRV